MKPSETNLYQEMTRSEKENIQDKAQRLTSLLTIWASLYPLVRAKRAAPASALVATVLPDLPMNLALLVGKLVLYIFTIDDIADERLLSYPDFIRASKAWEDIIRYGSTNQCVGENGDISAITSEIRLELSRKPLFPHLVNLLASRLRALCDTMAKEYEWGLQYTLVGSHTLPDLDDYIHGGIQSVGFPFWSTCVLILLDEPELLSQLEALNEIILQTAGAIRLYNDFGSYQRETQENNINAITIVNHMLSQRQPALSTSRRLEQAQENVLDLAATYGRDGKALAEQLSTGSGAFQTMVKRIIDFHANFYASRRRARDYHTTSIKDAVAMIQGE